MKKALNWTLRLLVGSSILFLLVYKVGFSEIIGAFSGFTFKFVPILVIIAVVTSFFATLNIAIFLLPLKHYVPILKLFKFCMVSWSLGLFVPGKLGEFGIVYFLRSAGVPVGEGMAVSTLDKIVTVVSLVFISCFALLIYFRWSLVWILLGLFALCVLMIAVLIYWEAGRIFVRDRILGKYQKLFKGFSKTMKLIVSKNKRVVFANIFLTLIKWAGHAAATLLIFMSFNHQPMFWHVFVISAVTVLLGLVPVTINGLGIKHSAAVFFYGFVGQPGDIVVAVYLVSTILTYLIAAVFLSVFAGEIGTLMRTVRDRIKGDA